MRQEFFDAISVLGWQPSQHVLQVSIRVVTIHLLLIVNRYGRLLAIEQKNGHPVRVGAELVKTYVTGPKSVRAQVARNIHNLRHRVRPPSPRR